LLGNDLGGGGATPLDVSTDYQTTYANHKIIAIS